MPQKLIRLTTSSINESGKCEFTGLFNEDIDIPQNSEIALHSLSLERRSQEIEIKQSNNIVKFASVNATTLSPSTSNQTSRITPVDIYNKSNNLEFLNSVTNAPNRVCSLLDDPSQMNIQYKCSVNTDGRVEIEGRVEPFYTLDQGHPEQGSTDPAPSFPSFARPNASVVNLVPDAEAVQTGVGSGAQGIFRDSDTTISPPNPSEAYLFGDYPFIKSTGSLRARFKRLLANGGQVSAYIGLVKGKAGYKKLLDSTMTEADMEYAIRVNGHNNAMDYKTSPAGAWVPTVTPINHTVAGADYNDIIEIVIANDKFIGQIHQNNVIGGTGTDIKTTLASANVEEGEDYYWFISFVEGKDKVVFDLCSVSLDPFTGDSLRRNALEGANQALPTNSTQLTTVVEYNRDARLTPIFRLNQDVANFLGFSNDQILHKGTRPYGLKNVEILAKADAFDGNQNIQYPLSLGFKYVASEPFDNSYEADSYIIDTQSFLLDSYDSYGLDSKERDALSGGSRRSILAVIPQSEEPVSGTANGVIQYQPNTLNFIRIRNRSDIRTRQMRFRLLTGRYQDVIIQNMAALTILIRDPEGYKE